MPKKLVEVSFQYTLNNIWGNGTQMRWKTDLHRRVDTASQSLGTQVYHLTIEIRGRDSRCYSAVIKNEPTRRSEKSHAVPRRLSENSDRSESKSD